MNQTRMRTPYYNPIEAGAERRIILNWMNRSDACLDLGGGFGRIAGTLEPLFATFVLTDASTEGTKFASRRLRKALVVRADAEHIPARNSTFDYVVMIKVIHLLPDPRRVLAEILRVTKNNGTVIVSIPNMPANRLLWRLGMLLPSLRWLVPSFGPAVWPLGRIPYFRPHIPITPDEFQLIERRGTGLFDNYLGKKLSRLGFLHKADAATSSLWFLKLEVLYKFRVSK